MCVFFCVCPWFREDQQLSLCVSSSTPASCAEAQFCPILMNVVKLVRCWDPGCFLPGLLRLHLMCRQMMYWKPSHQGVVHMSPFAWLCVAYCGAEGWAWMRLYFLWGIVRFSSMDIAGCGRRNKQTFSVFHHRPPTPPCSISSGMGLFTEAVRWLMFVCVMRLFICLANKCIINKPLPHVFVSVYSLLASLSFYSSAN